MCYPYGYLEHDRGVDNIFSRVSLYFAVFEVNAECSFTPNNASTRNSEFYTDNEFDRGIV
jgi:hypothetical protein